MEEESKPELAPLEGTLFELQVQKEGYEPPFLFLAKDPGAANCLSPVAEALLAKNRHIYLFAQDKANDIFNQKFSQRTEVKNLSPETVAKKETPVLLSSGTTDPEFEGNIIERIKRANPKTQLVLIEDFPGSLVGLLQKLVNSETPIFPDLVLVTSRASQKNLKNRFPHLGKNKIIPVGQPAFDSLLLENTETINEKVRRDLGLSQNDLLVTYIGIPSQDHPGLNLEAIEQTVSALNIIAKRRGTQIYLINRNHPREASPLLYTQALDKTSDNVRVINEPEHQKLTTREITAASNLIVTTFSTAGLETALRGARPQTKFEQTGWLPLHIFLPQAQKIIQRSAGKLPVIELGATAVAFNENEITPIIEKSLFNSKFKNQILKAQKEPLRKEYRFYGKRTSTNRVLLWLRFLERTKP